MDATLPVNRSKSKFLALIGVVIALFLVSGIAFASFYVSNRLATTSGVTPNAPASEPQAAGGCTNNPSKCKAGKEECVNGVCKPIKKPTDGTYHCDPNVCKNGFHCTVENGYEFCRGEANSDCNTTNANCASGLTCKNNKCVDDDTPSVKPWPTCPAGSCAQCDKRNTALECTTDPYCGDCSSDNVDKVKCSGVYCDNSTEHCCPSGCKPKAQVCGTPPTGTPTPSPTPVDKEVCYFDSKALLAGKLLSPGDKINVRGWGGVCRVGKLLPDIVNVSLCNSAGTGCQTLNGSSGAITRENRSEAVSQANFCDDGVPGKPNKLGFLDTVMLPSTTTPGDKILKISIVTTNTTGAKVTEVCPTAIFTVKSPPVVGNCVDLKAYKPGTTPILMTATQLANLKVNDEVLLACEGTLPNLDARFSISIDGGANTQALSTGYLDSAKKISTYKYKITKAGKYVFNAQVSSRSNVIGI